MIESVLSDTRLQTLLALIFIDVVLGIAAALATGSFQWEEVGRFYSSTVLPIFMGYAAISLAVPFISTSLLGPDGAWLSEGATTLFWGAGIVRLLASILASVKKMGLRNG